MGWGNELGQQLLFLARELVVRVGVLQLLGGLDAGTERTPGHAVGGGLHGGAVEVVEVPGQPEEEHAPQQPQIHQKDGHAQACSVVTTCVTGGCVLAIVILVAYRKGRCIQVSTDTYIYTFKRAGIAYRRIPGPVCL